MLSNLSFFSFAILASSSLESIPEEALGLAFWDPALEDTFDTIDFVSSNFGGLVTAPAWTALGGLIDIADTA